MLPPPRPEQEDMAPEQEDMAPEQEDMAPEQEDMAQEHGEMPELVTETLTVESLRHIPGLTRCPYCEEVVLTETYSRMGSTTWLLCCTCAITGCVAGCCFIPFFNDRFKNIYHRCPSCQENIHTYKPF
ncbi:lipopolysaccharide-induced tumor necrosis factor-alpha factor homolog [Eleginops maclovinus]